MRRWGVLLLAIWLIATSLVALLQISFTGRDLVLGVLAGAAGVLLLLENLQRKAPRNLGLLVLAAWLILSAVVGVAGVDIPASGILLAVLAGAAGVLLLLGR